MTDGTRLAPDGSAVTQFSLLDALLVGDFEGGIRLDDILAAGDVGIGCGNELDGELVLLDGHAYRCRADDSVEEMPRDERLPFAEVCRFDSPGASEIGDLDHAALEADIEQRLLSLNLFHAIRIDGRFSSVRVRTAPRQHRPYRPFAEVARGQHESELVEREGTVVGFWAPRIYQGITVAGFHLHYIDRDRARGGHVLDLRVRSARLSLTAFARFDLRLPVDAAFLATPLVAGTDGEVLAVEGR